jgi:hypothetical protein
VISEWRDCHMDSLPKGARADSQAGHCPMSVQGLELTPRGTAHRRRRAVPKPSRAPVAANMRGGVNEIGLSCWCPCCGPGLALNLCESLAGPHRMDT